MMIDNDEKQKSTSLMLKLVIQGELDIEKGNVVDQEEFFKEMDKRLGI